MVFKMNTHFHGGNAQAMVRSVKKFNASGPNVAIELTQGQWA